MKNKTKQIKILFFTIILFAVFGVAGKSNAEITSVSGDMIDGGNITINGTDFGSIGPNIIIFSDCEGADGVSVNNNDPQIGTWYSHDSDAKYSTLAHKSGNSSIIIGDGSDGSDFGSSLVAGVPDVSGVNGLEEFQEMFMSISIRDLGTFPCGTYNSFSTISSQKDTWLMLGPRGDNTSYCQTLGYTQCGHDLVFPSWIGSQFAIGGNNTSMVPSFYLQNLEDNWKFGEWVTYQVGVKLNPIDPYGNVPLTFFNFVNSNGYFTNIRSGNMMEDQTSEGVTYSTWDRLKIGAWYREDINALRVADDIYVATGPGAMARVIIADASTLESSTDIAILTPVTWSDTQIVATFREGSFSNGIAYLFVIDENNVSSLGYSITLGGVSDVTPPSHPTGLSVS